MEALQQNSLATDSDLFVFSDGAKSNSSVDQVNEVRAYTKTIDGFKSVSIVERSTNVGLATSIIDGVTKLCTEHGRLIIVEDDLVTSPWFLTYMNQALSLYESDTRVASIHGYCFPVKEQLPETFFRRGADCWGWATWSRAWNDFEPNGSKLLQMLRDRRLEREFDLNGATNLTKMLRDQIAGKNDSWAVRWHASCFLRDRLTLYPGRSLVQNIGNDGSGVHSDATEQFTAHISETPIRVERIDLAPCEHAERKIEDFYRRTTNGALLLNASRILNRLAAFFKKKIAK